MTWSGTDAPESLISAPQCQTVITGSRTTAEQLMIRVATEAGLRIGEICGLQRRDVNLDARTITVKRQGNRNTTKSGQVRVITMRSGVVEKFLHLSYMPVVSASNA